MAMVVLRSATPEDALGITIVNVYTWKTAYTGLVADALIDERIRCLQARAAITRQTIAQEKACFVVAVDGAAIIGFCMFGASRDAAEPGAGEVYALYVLRGYHGQGVGKRLFAAAVQGLRAMGHERMILNCLKGNPALGFYRHMGGVPVRERTDEVAGHRITEDVLLFASLATMA